MSGVHKVGICELEESQSVRHVPAQTPVVAYRSAKLSHLEIVRTVEQVGIELHTRPVEVEAAARYPARRKKARESKRPYESHLVRVEHIALAAAARLPFVAAGKLYRELLAATENILVCDAESKTGPI